MIRVQQLKPSIQEENMFTNRLFSFSGHKTYPQRRIVMKTMIFVVLLAIALSSCAPAVAVAPAAAPTQAPTPMAVKPTVAPALAEPTTPPTDTAPSPTEPAITPWSLVAVGDSIPYNSPDDCYGCTGFVDRYAAAITQATGHPVEVQNLSQHNGLRIDNLLDELKTDTGRREALASADIIIVSIAHNDTPWNDNNDPCDGPSTDNIDWSKFSPTCGAAAAEVFRPKFESAFAQIVALRAEKPTIFLTINAYNDWIGLPGVDISAEGTEATQEVLDAWNAMICKAAQANSFTCADIYHAFNGPDGLTPAPDFIAADTVHPSDKGNEVIAQVLADLGYTPLVAPGSATNAPEVATSSTEPAITPWSLVAVGDWLADTSPDNCQDCTGFVDRYAAAITQATGHPVEVQNLSQNLVLKTDALLEKLKTDVKWREALASADIIIVSVANFDNPVSGDDDPCHAFSGETIDWTKVTPTCTAAAAENFRPKLESVFAEIVALRAGKPTIFRTINGYNDWIGTIDLATGLEIPPEATNPLHAIFDAWSAMICKAAEANGFGCADTYHAFNGPDGLKPTGDLTPSKLNSHPSDKGNEVIAQVLADLGYAPLVAPGSATNAPEVATSSTQPAAAAVLTPQQVAAELEKTLQDLTVANQFSGSVLVAQNGQVILSQGYGLADREKKTPITAQTKFPIGKTTKQFTAMAIMLLQEQGKLNVQDKICTYLTGCPEEWKAITIHQLLTQTSGIPDNSDAFIAQDVASSAPLEQMLAEVKKLPLNHQPGESFIPNDMDYILLGKIIEAASGESYAAFLQQNIFEPLQMSNTGFDPNRNDVAIGYTDRTSVADPTNRWVLFSAAGLYSTVEDLYRYDQALYTEQLLPQKALDTMVSSHVQSDKDGLGFGYGWYVALYKPSLVKMPGNGNGFDNTYRRYLDDKVTIIELSNEQDYDNVTFVNWIQKALLGE
jgi:CubicO group peptidase (beta-lactamase class C family)/lysophospholipase L1-like esterase